MNTFVADPHWGWWIVWYFFLGGIAAGAYFIAALVELVGGEHDRRLGRVGYLLAAPLVAVCGALLILDLNQPLRFWHMLLDAETLRPHIKYWSPMSIGAWALLLFGAISTASFVGALAESGRCGLGRWATTATRLHRGFLGRAFDLIGATSGFFIASYTGALLTATNQPIWSDSPWIAALFLASAATSGIAALQFLCRSFHMNTHTSLDKLDGMDGWALGLELVLLGCFLWSLGLSAGELVRQPPLAVLVAGSLCVGVCVPLVLRRWPRSRVGAAAYVSPALVLLGAFVLRYSVLAAAPAYLGQTERPGSRAYLKPGLTRPISNAPAPPADSSPASRQVDELLRLVRRRLELMDDVAWAKWAGSLPIDDPERERALLAWARQAATERGTDADAVEQFFVAQMVAAKQVQQAWFDQWSRQPPADSGRPPDLARDLRPRIDELNRRLLDAFAVSLRVLADSEPGLLEDARRTGLGDGVRLDERQRAELFDELFRAAGVSNARSEKHD